LFLGYDVVSVGFCKHGMARPRVANRGYGPQIWRVATNVFNQQSRRAENGWSFNLEVMRGTLNSSP